MWLLLILSLCFMSIFTIFQIPKSWYKNKFLKILIILFNIFGFLSTICILFFVHIIKDSFFKEVIIWFYTIYFTILVFSFAISLFRYFLILCCKITRLNNFIKILIYFRFKINYQKILCIAINNISIRPINVYHCLSRRTRNMTMN